MAIVMIAVGVGFGWYNNQAVTLNSVTSAHYTAEPTNHLSFLANWDGPDYLQIATHGYQSLSSTSFFPLYPILIHLLNIIIGSPLDSALIISWLSFIGASYFYIKIIKQLFKVNRRESLRGLAFFVLFPTATFLIATYTESLFCCLALGAIYFALNKRYISTACLAFLLGATHITGPIVLALLFMLLLEAGAPLLKATATTLVGAGGLLAYMIYLAARFNDPLGFVSAQKGHGWLNSSYGNLFTSINGPSLILFILILISAIFWWPRRKSFSVYSALFLLIPLVGREWGGFPRYALEVFPLQLMFYSFFRHKQTAYVICLVASSIAWTYFMLQYAAGYVGG